MIELLHSLATALDAFHRLDPAGWFAWRSLLSPRGALMAMGLGALCLTIGSREGIFRFVAIPLGVLLGVALTGPILALIKSTALPTKFVEIGVPLFLGVLSGIVPQTIAFTSLGAVGALIGTEVVAEHEEWVGAFPGFFLAGVLGIVFSKVVDTLASAAFGALLLVGGAMAAFSTSSVGHVLSSSAWAPVIAAGILTASGAALQMVLFSDSEASAERKAKSREKKERAKDDRARDQRLAEYGKKG